MGKKPIYCFMESVFKRLVTFAPFEVGPINTISCLIFIDRLWYSSLYSYNSSSVQPPAYFNSFRADGSLLAFSFQQGWRITMTSLVRIIMTHYDHFAFDFATCAFDFVMCRILFLTDEFYLLYN